LKKIVPERRLDFVARGLPFLAAKFPTHESYGRASVAEILGEQLGAAKVLEAGWLETTVFLNRGTNFIARPLPVLAQAAPAFGVCVGDFDGDGHEDIFLAQNFFAVQTETPRLDAGLGLWLRGNGRGDFTAMSAAESGVRIFGEQRGAALADYDGDGRVDLLVGQNGQRTMFVSQHTRPPGAESPAGRPARKSAGDWRGAAVGRCVRVWSRARSSCWLRLLVAG